MGRACCLLVMKNKRRKILFNVGFIALIYAIFFCYGRFIAVDGGVSSGVKFSNLITKSAVTYDVPPGLVAAVIHAESNFNPKALSNKGARGLMQITGGTARYLRLKNSHDPEQNVLAGCKYLRELIDLFNGNIMLAIAAYNAGPGAVNRYDGVPPYRETKEYVKKVLGFFNIYRQFFTSSPLAS